MKRLPDFIIIGAAKCGTTTLYKKLTMHPDVFMSTPKEPEFFARDDIYLKGLDWYSDLFSSATGNQICGEASTLYSLATLFPDIIPRMHSAVPQTKLIYVLRNPVERCFSYYVQLVKNYRKNTRDFKLHRTFDECLFPERYPKRCDRKQFFAGFDNHLPDTPELLIDGSRYMTHIKNYLSAFDRKQLLLIDFQELIDDSDTVMATICNFLALDSQKLPPNMDVKENISSVHYARADKESTRQRLLALGKKLPYGQKLIQMVPKTMKKQFLDWYTTTFKIKAKDSRPPKMSQEAETFLRHTFQDEILELEKFWQRDLTTWKQHF